MLQVFNAVWYYDNCASVSLVNDLSALVEVVPVSPTFRVGGIGDGIVVTHRGYIPFLPRSVGRAYYSADASANLISLGFVQSQGGSYASVGRRQLEVRDPPETRRLGELEAEEEARYMD